VLEYLRAHPQIRAEPVILTSSANERDRARAGALAVQHYRIKPDDFGTLQQTVQDIAALDHAPD
jgi:CheY-like chemotaxis protein